MAIDTFAEHGEPDPGRDDRALEAQASAAFERRLEDRPSVVGEIKETVCAHIYLQELVGRACEAEHAAQDAQHRRGTLATKLDPAGHRILGFALGAALVAVLVVLDAIPLNWAAQAFGLDSAGTWLVTFILVIASLAAMLGFEVTRGHPRRRALLAAVVTAGYLALLGPRTDFLATMAAGSFFTAVLQATILTATSAGLILRGSAVIVRTRPLNLSRAHDAMRRTRQAATEARAAQNQAAERLRRHIGGLRQMLLPWALGSAAPLGVDRAQRAAALERAIRALFPAS